MLEQRLAVLEAENTALRNRVAELKAERDNAVAQTRLFSLAMQEDQHELAAQEAVLDEAVGENIRFVEFVGVNTPHIERGMRLLDGAHKGAERKHGQVAQREAKYREQQDEVDRIHREHPSMTWTAISELAARQFGISGRTIRRHCTDPTKPQNNTSRSQ
ncbi:MAG TPA: hypothetical protein ENK49_03890 [Gammaproteobacteria bacterium]|nr:hypothetical protein [Gammaproteobacteria bacterium]